MSKLEGLERRHRRVRKKIHGTPDRPRLSVFRSNRQIYTQIIDDNQGRTLVGVSSLKKDAKGNVTVEDARRLGMLVGKLALEKGITQVVFDRGGYKYHGQVKALADGAREAGLIF